MAQPSPYDRFTLRWEVGAIFLRWWVLDAEQPKPTRDMGDQQAEDCQTIARGLTVTLGGARRKALSVMNSQLSSEIAPEARNRESGAAVARHVEAEDRASRAADGPGEPRVPLPPDEAGEPRD